MTTWGPTPVSLGFYSSATTPTTNHHRSPSLICAHPRRIFHPPQSSSSSQRRPIQEDIGGVGHAVLNALHSDSQTLARNQSKQERKQRTTVKEERELSGSEVLLALQKAKAMKGQTLKTTTTRTTKKKKKGGSKGGGEVEASVDCGNVRPLNVKGDWGVRLEELESRFQGFLNTSSF